MLPGSPPTVVQFLIATPTIPPGTIMSCAGTQQRRKLQSALHKHTPGPLQFVVMAQNMIRYS